MGRASLPTTLKNETGTGAKAHSSATKRIISQNPADRLVEKVRELDDAEKSAICYKKPSSAKTSLQKRSLRRSMRQKGDKSL